MRARLQGRSITEKLRSMNENRSKTISRVFEASAYLRATHMASPQQLQYSYILHHAALRLDAGVRLLAVVVHARVLAVD